MCVRACLAVARGWFVVPGRSSLIWEALGTPVLFFLFYFSGEKGERRAGRFELEALLSTISPSKPQVTIINLDKHFSHVAKLVHEAAAAESKAGHATLIHCFERVSRSASLGLAILMINYHMSLTSAIVLMRNE